MPNGLPAIALACLLGCVAEVRADAPHAALDAVRAAEEQIRVDPERSRREAEQALVQLARAPDADLEIRARLILCDYLVERDGAAARRQIDAMRALLPRAQRPALGAALLGCEGELNELSGDSLRAMALFEQAVEVAERHADDERLAYALHRRGYLRGVQGH
jgi:hypothetical protein